MPYSRMLFTISADVCVWWVHCNVSVHHSLLSQPAIRQSDPKHLPLLLASESRSHHVYLVIEKWCAYESHGLFVVYLSVYRVALKYR